MNTAKLYRLSEAREMRGMTVAELADIIGVSRQTVYKYENCTVIPPAETIDIILETLDFPLPFLTTTSTLSQSGSQLIYFRDMKTNTAKYRNLAKNWLMMSYEVISLFEQYIDLPETNLPVIDIPDFKSLDDSMIYAIAEKTRRHWKLGDGPISNLTILFENNGIVVVRKAMDADKLDACSALRHGRPCILAKKQTESCARDILNLAHELGHLVMHQGVTDEDLSNKETFNLIEEQAWRFASAFLLPPAVFSRELGYPTLGQFLVLKRRWRISIQSMIMYSRRLEIINDEKKQYFFRELTRRDLRKEEPLDAEIPVEVSSLLLECANVIENEGFSTRDDLFQRSHLSLDDYRQIIGASKSYLEPVIKKPKLRIVN